MALNNISGLLTPAKKYLEIQNPTNELRLTGEFYNWCDDRIRELQAELAVLQGLKLLASNHWKTLNPDKEE